MVIISTISCRQPVERQMCNFVVVPAADELRSRLITVFNIPAAADEAATRVFHSSFYRPLLFSYFCSPSDSSTAGSNSWLHLFISFTTSPENHSGGAGRLHLASGERKESGSGNVCRSTSWSHFMFWKPVLTVYSVNAESAVWGVSCCADIPSHCSVNGCRPFT